MNPPKLQEKSISVLFAGDYAPCRRYERLTMQFPDSIFNDLRSDIQSADISFVNVESPFTHTNRKLSKVGSNFRADPACVQPLVRAGFDVAGLANNHIMDYEEEGLCDTLRVCHAAGMETCGAGSNLAAAQQPTYLDCRGIRIAFLAVAEREFSMASPTRAGAAPLDVVDNLEQLSIARKTSDLVFMTIHGGNEYYAFPSPNLRKTCQCFIRHGADAVVCHHSHVPGVFESYQGKPIIYGLGNLIFDHSCPPKGWNEGYAALLKYGMPSAALQSFEILPYEQSVEIKGAKKMIETKNKEFMAKITENNASLQNMDAFMEKWMAFCESKYNSILARQYWPMVRGIGWISRYIKLDRVFIPNNLACNTKLNMIMCDSIREVLQETLQSIKNKREGLKSVTH